MERAQHQVSGLCCLDRDLHRLEISHLANQHDIRIFAESRPQRRLETLGVISDFTLVDQGFVVLVHELDRILDGDDVY